MFEELNFNEILIETTRNCNIQCTHCMRGEKEAINISLNYINNLLCQVESIRTITFTGGEPSLNVEAIEYFIEQVIRRNISIGSFYIATNGISIKPNFVIACLKLYSICDEKELCQIDVSNDYYHAEFGNYDTELLDGLSFFKRKNKEECYSYNGGKGLLQQGFAEENFSPTYKYPNSTEIDTKDDFNEAIIYLNVNGDIINGCDWSYKNQEHYKICAVTELVDYYNSLNDG